MTRYGGGGPGGFNSDQAPLPPAPKIDIKGENAQMINNYMGQVFEGNQESRDEKKQKLLADYQG